MFSCFLSLKSRLGHVLPNTNSSPSADLILFCKCYSGGSRHLAPAYLPHTLQSKRENCTHSAKNVFHLVKCQSQREARFCIFLGSPFFTSEHWGTNHTQFTYTLCTLPCTWGSPAHHISINSPCISFSQICTFFVSLSTSFSTASEANLIHSLIPPLLFLLS